MNFIKSLKFSVKGIDTTRYISNEVRNLLILERGFHPLSNFSPKAKIILIPSHFERSEKSPPFNRRQTYYFVILTSVVREEKSPQLILFGWSSRRVSAPPRYNEETPRKDGSG